MLRPVHAVKPSTPTSVEGGDIGLVEIEDTSSQGLTRCGKGNEADDWLCAICHHHVTREKDRFGPGGESGFCFTNPMGFRFNILTFLKAPGGRDVDEPTLENTWFPGYAWSFCVCDHCRVHLGWFYTGPSRFVGLIRERIVLAAAVMN